jgi:hypothetical protein
MLLRIRALRSTNHSVVTVGGVVKRTFPVLAGNRTPDVQYVSHFKDRVIPAHILGICTVEYTLKNGASIGIFQSGSHVRPRTVNKHVFKEGNQLS